MIVTTYNQHVRLLSSEPFGWFAPPKSTRSWEPTLFMESLHLKPLNRPSSLKNCSHYLPFETELSTCRSYRRKTLIARVQFLDVHVRIARQHGSERFRDYRLWASLRERRQGFEQEDQCIPLM